MTYFCFIQSESATVSHMEPLAAGTPEAAAEEAAALLRQHASGVSAHVYEDDQMVLEILASTVEGPLGYGCAPERVSYGSAPT